MKLLKLNLKNNVEKNHMKMKKKIKKYCVSDTYYKKNSNLELGLPVLIMFKFIHCFLTLLTVWFYKITSLCFER